MPKISEKRMQERREHIIDVAFELFAERGYSATGLRSIMEAAYISKGGIYVYFKCKADILLAIINRFDKKRHDITKELDPSTPADTMMAHYIRRRLKAFQLDENQKYARLALEFWSLPSIIPGLSDILAKRYRDYQMNIKRIILRGIDEGIFHVDRPVDDIVGSIMSTIDGAGSLSSMGHVVSDGQIEATVATYLTYLKGASHD